jgi:REP element-mobilizing transposase RayT
MFSRNADRPIGIHFMLMPSTSGGTFPSNLQPPLELLAKEICQQCSCAFRALCVLDDHLHIMLASSDEDVVQSFFSTFMDRGLEVIRGTDDALQNFDWDDKVHVTLVPPWHVDIMTSFVRDQKHYHRTHSFAQEIDEIFMPSAGREVFDDDSSMAQHAS